MRTRIPNVGAVPRIISQSHHRDWHVASLASPYGPYCCCSRAFIIIMTMKLASVCSRAAVSSSSRPWQKGYTGLIMAAVKGNKAIVRLLLENKAEVNAATQVLRLARDGLLNLQQTQRPCLPTPSQSITMRKVNNWLS